MKRMSLTMAALAVVLGVLLSLDSSSRVQAATYPFVDDFNDGTFSPIWTVKRDGCAVEEANGALHVYGTVAQGNWNGSGVATGNVFPAGSFTASVDFRVPKFSGSGVPLTYLIANSPGGQIAVFYDYPYGPGYRVQAWTDPQRFSAWLPAFGDEQTTFHRMKLVYDSSSQTATGYVDDRMIGSIIAPMSGNMSYSVVNVTDVPGMQVDAYYDNFQAVPEPSILVLLGMGTLGLLAYAWRRRRS